MNFFFYKVKKKETYHCCYLEKVMFKVLTMYLIMWNEIHIFLVLVNSNQVIIYAEVSVIRLIKRLVMCGRADYHSWRLITTHHLS